MKSAAADDRRLSMNGNPPQSMFNTDAPEVTGSEGKAKIFCIGAFCTEQPADSVHTLLTAAELLRKRKCRFKLVLARMAGQGNQPAFNTGEIRLYETVDVGMAGADKFFARLDLCLFVGISDSAAHYMMEGMKIGVPWIAVGTPETIDLLYGEEGNRLGPAGLVVPTGAADMIADYCEWFIRNPDVRKLFAESAKSRAKGLH
ncbi:glycosyltransferase [Indiicoccus explosivorum]|uniref:glycosyltransferase n=1 Tax=Indiicoccus explosivorum TaxID=1917864 RepID=UPI0013905263|nr:glycosyltransferase [Indiicoccus explosivorum]